MRLLNHQKYQAAGNSFLISKDTDGVVISAKPPLIWITKLWWFGHKCMQGGSKWPPFCMVYSSGDFEKNRRSIWFYRGIRILRKSCKMFEKIYLWEYLKKIGKFFILFALWRFWEIMRNILKKFLGIWRK